MLRSLVPIRLTASISDIYWTKVRYFERVSGLPFEEYNRANIFRPLGMLHATFIQPLPDSLKPMMSNGYDLASQEPKPFELVPPEPAPDGSLSITGADMAPFMIAHLQNGKYGPARILQQQTAGCR